MLPVAAPPPPPPPALHAPRPCLRQTYRDAVRPDSLGSHVSDTLPLRVHWADPDYAERAAQVLAWAEHAWTVQIDQLGFRPPVLPDSAAGPELDIYLAPVGEWQAWVEPDVYADAVSGDGYMGATTILVIDQDVPDPWMEVYVSHEFNHVLQYATDFSEETYTIWEATAVAAQTWTLGDRGEWDYDVVYFQEAPWAPVVTGDSYYLWDNHETGWLYEYGAALWMMHLDQIAGSGDGSAGPALWDATANEGWDYEPDVADAIEDVTGDDLGVFLNDLARTRWLTGARWDERGLADARDWTDEQAVPVTAEWTGSLPRLTNFAEGPMITGQSFVTVELDGTPGRVVVDVSSESGLESAVQVLWWTDGAAGESQSHGRDPRVVIDADGVTDLVIAVSNLGDGWDGDDDPYVPGDQVLEVLRREGGLACGCTTGGGGAGLAWLVAALIGVRRRSRRVTSPRP